MAKGGLRWIWISILVIILDQASKLWMDSYLSFNQPVNILPFFDLRLLYNTGAAWSFLADAGGWQRWFLAALAFGISIVLIVWLTRLERKQVWLAIALTLVLGGAVGNLIDRVIYGYVIDFIDIYYQQWHWPAFNIADSAISVGAVMLVIDAILEGRKE
ncbi:signal peptidase II [Candidatus Halobeggiatoa sp. HSG11]|nr:signal peptidase II [Candidatus Halobeggiatoa sp. HSG11]